MEHYKSRDNDFFHFTNPHDDVSEFDDHDYDSDYDQLQYYDLDDDCSCDFNFHTSHPFCITESRFQTSGVMNQNDAVEQFGAFDHEALVLQLDNIMKKLCDELQHTIVGVGAQISRLEDETCKLDKYVENVKNAEDAYHGMTHKKLRQMQSILEEVQDDVLFLRDKHEIAETQLQPAKLQASKRDKITPMNPQQHIPLPAPQSSSHTRVDQETLFYRPTSPQAPEITSQKYPIPPNFTQSYQPISFQSVSWPQSSPLLSHCFQKTLDRPSYISYSSNVQHCPTEPEIWDSTQEPKVSLPHVRPPTNHKHMPKFASYFDINPQGQLPSLHEISNVKYVGPSLNSKEQTSISNYPDIPVARALPIAVDVEDGSSSGENGNTILVDDIVDKVTGMGFRRDRVRASVKKMTQNGSPVDFNSVLDRMMNNR